MSVGTDDILDQLQMVQRMIDMSAAKLNSLRTEGATNTNLIQQEIRTVEGKLVKLFSRMLVAKQTANRSQVNHVELPSYPSLVQWLQVVGINEAAIKEFVAKCGTVEGLLSLPGDKINTILDAYVEGAEDSRRLQAALHHLRAYTERQKQGHKDSTSEIYWDSWDTTVPREKTSSARSSRSSATFESDDALPPSSPSSGENDIDPSRLSASDMSDAMVSPRHSPRPLISPVILQYPVTSGLKRSRSDEANIGNRIISDVTMRGSATVGKARGKKLSPVIPLTIEIPKAESGDQLSVLSQSDSESEHNRSSYSSSSPKTPTRHVMGHTIKHRFSQKKFMVSLACDFCQKILLSGVKCKECKYKCHKKCAKRAPPSCCLPKDYEEFFIQRYEYRSLPIIKSQVKRTNSEPFNIAYNVGEMIREKQRKVQNRSVGDLYFNSVDSKNYPDMDFNYRQGQEVVNGGSGSTSSASSPPSSPVPSSGGRADYSPGEEQDGFPTQDHFYYPSRYGTGTSTMTNSDLIESTGTLTRTESTKSYQSSNTTNSNESTLSGGDVPGVEDLEIQISDVDPESRKWGQRVASSRAFGKAYMLLDLHTRGSLMSEWVVPFEEIEIFDVLGSGRFGKVYRGRWHGEVAVKMIEIDNPTEEQLNAFKFQVSTFRKTRHDNTVLFMGACMDPPKLAIITSLCRGYTLYTHVHIRKDNFPLAKIAQITTQIAQGMGYLHARGIVHTDLRSKNVFLELNSKAVITDFGLYSVAGLTARSARPGYLMVPYGWLYYLAPEVIRTLTPFQDAPESKQFTTKTDVYSFGTVWYEMIAGGWPWKKQNPESIIYKVGKGHKQSLNIHDIPGEVKEALILCWAQNPESRPTFSQLLKTIDRLPKKHRLHRSPSQPCTVGRPAEALI
ncbi:kinase suppressor of Ras 2 isoform X2 [Nematostella vectensis]|uniref:kinase suppressor of Ras 2 isoform X2 n=1 Tax=Nematostella vectensis TaxID=45351 RepID=UPI00207789AC|nr:kinase suppressor of Ras 2 isoform X2 [Nematostella vectensis]